MTYAKRVLAMVLAAVAVGAAVFAGPAANASSVGEVAPQAACVGSSFSGTLGPDQAICWGSYQVIMQTNGDLVLWNIAAGRACWTSGTNRAPNGDTSATFHTNWISAPSVTIDSASQGRLAEIWGAHTATSFGTNANVNSRGEFWIGYKRIGWC